MKHPAVPRGSTEALACEIIEGMASVTDNLRRAASCTRAEQGGNVLRGLTVGAVLGVITGLITGNWSLVAWLAVIGSVLDAGWTFAGNFLHNVRGGDCEWASEIRPSPSLLAGVVVSLYQRSGRATYRTWGLRCEVTSPSGRSVVREGQSNTYTFSTGREWPGELGRFDVAWSAKMQSGRWVSLLQDHFVMEQKLGQSPTLQAGTP